MNCSSFSPSRLAIPAVCLLISFLAYTSQYFLLHFEPAPLVSSELWRINIFALCIWICFYRASTVDPGRVPKNWRPSERKQPEADRTSDRSRWCRRCDAPKPPRAHHCKACQRCVPKMDHHCPWTSNCISHATFPHFIRFLFYAVTGMVYLETCLWDRVLILWGSRHMPSYMGPTVMQITHLFVLFVTNSLTTFLLAILLVRSLWSLGLNTTTIESWEIERHETLLRRARHFGGYLTGPGGVRVRIIRQEFPYDIGIWSNIKAGMGGSSNVLSWFWPLAKTPDPSTGLEFEVNEFEGPNVSWPPPDPDRTPLPVGRERLGSYAFPASGAENFTLRRQKESSQDSGSGLDIRRRRRFHERLEHGSDESGSSAVTKSTNDGILEDGEEAWKNSEGERLRDFGVDEDAEFYDEEDIPLAILMQQRALTALKGLS